MVEVAQDAFAVACIWGLSDVHEYLGRLQMALYTLDKQTAGCNSLHDWLMNLAMDLTASLLYVVVKMASVNAIWLFLVKM